MEFSITQIAEKLNGRIGGNRTLIIRGVAPFEEAGHDQITLAEGPKYIKKLDKTNAGAVIAPAGTESSDTTVIKVENPRLAFAKALEMFHPHVFKKIGISKNAVIGEQFSFGDDVAVSPMTVIGDNVSLGSRVFLHPCVVIGDHVEIGDDVQIYPNVTILDRCKVGNKVIIHAGTVIGSDGYGFVPDGESYYKIPQTGIVCIEDNVEIGAGNTIDRATFGQTLIKKGVKTDNLVHIAHNVTVGENTVIVAQTGIAGSAKIGRHVAISGQVAIVGHIEVGDNVQVAGKAGITKSVQKNKVVAGNPAMPHRLWLKVQNILPRLPEFRKKLMNFEKRLNKIEEKNK